jgi:ribonuclease HII
MLEVIHNISLSFAIGIASSLEIEQLGIVGATFLAMKRSLAQISCEVHLLLVDGRATLPEYSGAQQALIKGDSLSFSIAAASILAKEARDSFMREQSKEYQEYGFDEHVGYGTKKHLEAIHKYGICNLHRKNFAPIKYLVDA